MTDEFTTAAKNEAARSYSGDWDPGEEVPVDDWGLSRMERDAFRAGAEWARDHLAAQEPTDAVLMTSREETISDRLSDAGYTEYAEDEDGGVTWVSAPLGEVLRIVNAAQEPTGDEHYAAAQVIYEATTEDDILRWPHVSDEETARCMNLARAALEAARDEKRNRR